MTGGRLENGESARRASPASRASAMSASSTVCSASASVASPSPASPSSAEASISSSLAASAPSAVSEAPSASSWSPVSSSSSSSSPALAAEFVGHVEGGQDVAHGAGEARPGRRSRRSAAARSAPARSSIQSRQRSTILRLDCGRRVAGQPLAHHQRDGVLQRRVGAVGDLLIVAAVIAVLQHRARCCRRRRACGGRRAPRRAPARPRRRRRGRSCRAARCVRWTARIVAGEPQRQRIADAAGDGDVVARSSCAAARAGAPCAADSVGRSAAKDTSRSGLPAMARMQPTTARLNGSVGPSAGLARGVSLEMATGVLRQLITTLAVDSGSSSLKQRW